MTEEPELRVTAPELYHSAIAYADRQSLLTEEEKWKLSECRVILSRPEVGREKVLRETESMGIPVRSPIV